MKIVFMGTSDFAVQCLDALCHNGLEPCAVISQPDKPKGRGYKLTPTPVKAYAAARDIPVYTPKTAKDGQLYSILDELNPDISVVVAYGQILPTDVLSRPRYGSVNVHASLLPMYRGAAPINRAIMDGCTRTGITTMYMDEGLDTGDMILTAETEILPQDDFESLHDRLAVMGGDLIVQTLRQIEDGTAPRISQTGETCYARRLENDDCKLDFTLPVKQLVDKIRGLCPVPCAFCTCGGKKIKIYSAHAADFDRDILPGTVVCEKGALYVKAADGMIAVTELQPEGKKRMNAASFLCGNHPQLFE